MNVAAELGRCALPRWERRQAPDNAQVKSAQGANVEKEPVMDEDDFEDDGDDFDEDDYIDCGLAPDGQCSKAGSEECDWECPYSRSDRYAGSEAWNKAHDAGVPVDGCACRECQAAR